MTRLTLHSVDTSPAESRPFVERALANNGFLPNLIGILANSPLALETYMTVSGITARGSLNLAEREVVQITAARIHGCEFCVAGHTATALKKAKLDPSAVVALQQGEDTGHEKLDAVRRFAEAVIASRGAVSDAELKAFRDAGYDEAQTLEVVLGVSLATLCNFANTLAQSPVNPQLEAYRPGVLVAA